MCFAIVKAVDEFFVSCRLRAKVCHERLIFVRRVQIVKADMCHRRQICVVKEEFKVAVEGKYVSSKVKMCCKGKYVL